MNPASRRCPTWTSLSFAGFLLLAGSFSWSDAPVVQPPTGFDIKAHYDKSEVMVPMRDGVRLYTAIYSPKQPGTYPILLLQTPYSAGPYGAAEYRTSEQLAPSEDFLRSGYIFVVQEGRGTYKSEGDFVNLRPIRTNPAGIDDSTDAYDAIEWLVHHLPANNGRVGQWGVSYPGVYTVMALIGAHPALRAVSPQATTFDAFLGDDDHRNGAFDLTGAKWWLDMSRATAPGHEQRAKPGASTFNFGTPWSYEFFLNAGTTANLSQSRFGGELSQIWKNLIDHPNYDEFWQSRNVGRHLAHVRIPVLNVMGWFDAYDPYGAMATYHAIEDQNPVNQSTLVAGPWGHGGWLHTDGSSDGDIEFGSKTSEYYQKELVFPFFQYYLKGEGTWKPAKATAFETGTNRWRHFDEWPPKDVKPRNLYFHAGGILTVAPPSTRTETFDSYTSDPAHPVPYMSAIAPDPGDQTFMTGDQRFTRARPDVVTYQTDVLPEPVTIAGEIPVDLYVSTTGTDSDWFVKVIDVFPPTAAEDIHDPKAYKMGLYEMLVGSNVIRAKYRHSYSAPEAMVPNKLTELNFTIRDKFHTFKAGHRIMVQVQSSWFPRIDRNPQVFTDIYQADASKYQKAIQKIYEYASAPSHITLPTIALPDD